MAATATLLPEKNESDRAFRLLATDAWHSSAPGKVRRAATSDDFEALWKAWKKHLDKRDLKPVAQLLPGKKSPLAWTLSAASDEQAVGLIDLLHRAAAGRRKAVSEASEQLPSWLAETDDAAADRLVALQALAWCHALPQLANETSPQLWCELLDRLLSLAEDAVAITEETDAAVAQLFRAELPLTLAYYLPELATARRLGKTAAEFLSTSIVEMLDGEGVLHGRYLSAGRDLLACWTRCRAVGNELKSCGLSKKAAEQFAWLVTASIRQCRHDGSQVLTASGQAPWSAPLFEAALDLDGDEADEEVADVALPGRTGGYEPEETWPAAGGDSEWASFATLRGDWARSANHVSVAYDQLPLRCELNIGKQTLFSAPWEFEIEADGKRLKPLPDDEWEQVCWESDADCDYLELELELSGGVKLQRSFLLAHDDQFLVITDTVLSNFAKQLKYRSRLPFAENVKVKADKKHTELTLGVEEPTLRVLPLALSEWKSDSRLGKLKFNDGALELEQTVQGSSLSAPIFIDLSGRRRKMPVTWRQLSVGEQRKVVPSDVAVGYRVEIGKAQWLFYRSLAPIGNRTVLGQNLNSEIMVCRFHRDGSVEELLEVE